MDPGEGPAEAEHLLSGNVSAVVRIGGTLRRTTGPWTPALHPLLRYLAEVGFEGAPRVLGSDEQGREVLTYIPGEVPRRASPEVATNRALVEVDRLFFASITRWSGGLRFPQV